MPNRYHNLLLGLVPTICLVQALAGSSVEALFNYRETFGDPGIYLNLEYAVPPHHLVHEQPVRNTAFDGHFATVTGDERIRGIRSERKSGVTYQFQTSKGHFVGTLKKAPKGCEWLMHYRIERGPVVKELGTLRSGFCS